MDGFDIFPLLHTVHDGYGGGAGWGQTTLLRTRREIGPGRGHRQAFPPPLFHQVLAVEDYGTIFSILSFRGLLNLSGRARTLMREVPSIHTLGTR